MPPSKANPIWGVQLLRLGRLRDSDYRLTFRQLHEATLAALEDSPYDRAPQLEGADLFKDRQIFTERLGAQRRAVAEATGLADFSFVMVPILSRAGRAAA